MDLRTFAVALAARATDDTPIRRVPGDRLSAAALGVREKKVTLQPAPNAPLLMRIVRTPYPLDPARPRRSPAWERPRTERFERLGRPGASWTSARPRSGSAMFRSPLRIEHGLPARPRVRKGAASEAVADRSRPEASRE